MNQQDIKNLLSNPSINIDGYIYNTSGNRPVVTADKVAVQISGTNPFDSTFQSLDEKLVEYDNSLGVIAAALNALAAKL